jgi:hypothetical protein
LDEIRRTAKENGGVPLGHRQFERETGVRYYDWFGKYWGRWGDALQEAGFVPNTLQDAFSDDHLIEKLIGLIRERGAFPGTGDLRLKKRNDSTFPNDKVFDNHFGSRAELRRAVVNYCQAHTGFDDVPALCGPLESDDKHSATQQEDIAEVVVGFVYLMKHGKHFKIGKTECDGTP